jgi:hypothetical protein
MKNWPESWQFLQSNEPDPKIRQLRRRFAAISNRYHRPNRLRQLYQGVKVPMLMIGCAAGAYATMVAGSPWDHGTTLRHYAAAFNCSAARAVGLAPAYEGEPGYWWRNDRDRDGIACEPWPGR